MDVGEGRGRRRGDRPCRRSRPVVRERHRGGVLRAVDVRQRLERSFQVPLGVRGDHAGGPRPGPFVRRVHRGPVPREQRPQDVERRDVEPRRPGRRGTVRHDPAELDDERRVRAGLARDRAVRERGRPPSDAHRPQQVGVERRGRHVLAAGQRPQCPDEEQVLLQAGVRLAQTVGGLDHGAGRGVRAVVGHDLRAVRPEGLGLRDDVERAALVELGVDDHERLEAAAELRRRPPHALRDGTDLAVLAAEHGDDAVRLTELVGAEHDALVPVQRHAPSIPRRADTPLQAPGRRAAGPSPRRGSSRAPQVLPRVAGPSARRRSSTRRRSFRAQRVLSRVAGPSARSGSLLPTCNARPRLPSHPSWVRTHHGREARCGSDPHRASRPWSRRPAPHSHQPAQPRPLRSHFVSGPRFASRHEVRSQRGWACSEPQSGAVLRGDELRRRRAGGGARADRAVHRGDDRLERRGRDVGVDADAPQPDAVDVELDVRSGLGVAGRAHRVLRVVVQRDRHALLPHHGEEGVDRTGADGLGGDAAVVDAHRDRQVRRAVEVARGRRLRDLVAAPLVLVDGCRQVLVAEQVPDLVRAELAALGVGALLHDAGELDLQLAGQVDRVVGLEQVRHPALARLGVDADDGLVRPADVLRVDGQVGNGPLDLVDGLARRGGLRLHRVEALVDGVLVRAAERRVDEVARPRLALRHGQLVAVLDGALDLVDVREGDLRVDALREQVHAEGDQVDVAGALPVAEQAALDAVRAGQVAELGGGHGGAAVVVRVQGEQHVLAVRQAAGHPLDRVGVDVGRRHLDRRGQVDDHLAVRGGLEDLEHGVADLQRDLELGARVGLRRVLVVDGGVVLQRGLGGLAQLRTGDGDVHDTLDVGAEHDLALHDRRRVVEVDDGLLGTVDRLVGALDEVLARLGQHLDRDVVGDRALVDQAADEVEVRLRGAREPDLDLLVAHADQQVEHRALALGVHRVDECLVAVTQVDGTPARGLLDALRRPGAVRQLDRDLLVERDVLVDRHPGGALGVLHRFVAFVVALVVSTRVCAATTDSATRWAVESGLVAAAKEEERRVHPVHRSTARHPCDSAAGAGSPGRGRRAGRRPHNGHRLEPPESVVRADVRCAATENASDGPRGRRVGSASVDREGLRRRDAHGAADRGDRGGDREDECPDDHDDDRQRRQYRCSG